VQKESITIICPVYNEEAVLSAFYQELRRVLDALKQTYDFTILFVADKGTDRTWEILRGLGTKDPSLKALFLSSRFGHQASLLAGLDFTSSAAAIMMDSDLQHPPSLIPTLLEKYRRGANVVHTVKVGNRKGPLWDRLISSLFYRFMTIMAETPIIPHASDFRLIDKRVIEIFRTDLRERNIFLRGLMSWIGFRQEFVPFEVSKRHSGRSKYSFAKMFSLGITGVTSFSSRPLRLAIYLGLMTSFLGLVLLVYTFVSYYTGKVAARGWASILSVLTFFSGVQLVVLGVLGEYVGRVFFEVKNRPHYFVEDSVNITPQTQRGNK
jgi:glycosyltransferase involved in cell wall biosynthesis